MLLEPADLRQRRRRLLVACCRIASFLTQSHRISHGARWRAGRDPGPWLFGTVEGAFLSLYGVTSNVLPFMFETYNSRTSPLCQNNRLLRSSVVCCLI